MTVRRSLIVNVAIQSLGAVSSLMVVALLAKLGGPAIQGRFAVFKALTDLQVAVLTLGLPTGFVYVINKALVPPQTVARWCLLAVPPLAIGAAVGTAGYFMTSHVHDQGTPIVLLLVVAVTASAYYTLMRAVILTQTDGGWFALLSALPSVSLAVIACAGVATGLWGLATSFALTGGVSALAALVLYGSTKARGDSPTLDVQKLHLLRPTLRRQSTHAFLQAVFQAGSILGTISMMKVLGASVEDVGQFNLAALAVAGPNLLAGMIAPVMFSRWTRTLSRSKRQDVIRRSIKFAFVAQCAVAVMAPFVPSLVINLFGQEYSPAAHAVLPYLFAILPLVATRLIAPAFQATGDTRIVSISWGLRLVPLIVLSPLIVVVDQVVLWATFVGGIGEYLALAAMLVKARSSRWQ